jgi:hypothetical protein
MQKRRGLVSVPAMTYGEAVGEAQDAGAAYDITTQVEGCDFFLKQACWCQRNGTIVIAAQD